jgi:tetratricopeptide (TPR) repeat protein
LHLDTAENKAELIKDVISLANSAPGNRGYILVGVDNDKYIVGFDKLEEERIQQLVGSHIRPSVVVRCTLEPVDVPGLLTVGKIEIEGIERPYRVTIPIDKLKQDDIFVRHGSVVEKATPEEIRRMEEGSQSFKEVGRRLRIAEKLVSLGNLEEAIDVYTQAIKLMPTAESFLGRGKAYRHQLDASRLSWDEAREIANRVYKDVATAIHLADSVEIEKDARLERFRAHGLASVDYEAWHEDLEWLKSKTTGYEYGEVLYLEYQAYDNWSGFASEGASEVVEAMTQAIQLGYKEPGGYGLRAEANFFLCNYGLALQDINTAIAGTTRIDKKRYRLELRANIQVKMEQFEEAYSSFLEAERLFGQLSSEKYHESFGYGLGLHKIEYDILWRYGLGFEFSQSTRPQLDSKLAKSIVLVLIASIGKDQIEERYVPIVPAIKGIVGHDYWNECENLRVVVTPYRNT